jgi:hypothetical protein
VPYLIIRVMSLVGRGGIILISKTYVLRLINYIYTLNLVGRSMGRCRLSRLLSGGCCLEPVKARNGKYVVFRRKALVAPPPPPSYTRQVVRPHKPQSLCPVVLGLCRKPLLYAATSI